MKTEKLNMKTNSKHLLQQLTTSVHSKTKRKNIENKRKKLYMDMDLKPKWEQFFNKQNSVYELNIF